MVPPAWESLPAATAGLGDASGTSWSPPVWIVAAHTPPVSCPPLRECSAAAFERWRTQPGGRHGYAFGDDGEVPRYHGDSRDRRVLGLEWFVMPLRAPSAPRRKPCVVHAKGQYQYGDVGRSFYPVCDGHCLRRLYPRKTIDIRNPTTQGARCGCRAVPHRSSFAWWWWWWGPTTSVRRRADIVIGRGQHLAV